MQIKLTRPIIGAAALAFAGSLAGHRAEAQAIGALTTAKTVQCQETFQTAENVGKPLQPNCQVLVQIAGPNQVKAIITPAGSKGKIVYYVAKGTSEHEYNGFSNTYRVLDSTPDAHQHDQVRAIAAVDLILNPDPNGDPDPKAQRVISKDTLNGRPMILRTDTGQPIKTSNNGHIGIAEKYWFDAQTGFPVRRSTVETQNGVDSTVTQLDFSNWRLNQPIAPAAFAFNPPSGSSEQIVPKLLTAGTPAPDFAALTPDGKTVHLSDYKGKVVVLDFWATWCGPCQGSMPHLEHVYQQIKDKNVTVLALCVWDKKPAYDKWVTANTGTKYTFPLAFDPTPQDDPKNIAGGLYHVTGIPTQYVIDKDGNVAATTSGYGDGDVELEKALHGMGISVPVAAENTPHKASMYESEL